MSTSPLRPAMVPVIRQMRAYFAPVNRATETPTIFDPAINGAFVLDSPPPPWLDLGWIDAFERYYETPTNGVGAGAKAFTRVQFRGPIEAGVMFEFREWGKLQMALAGGSEHMNVLAAAASATPAPSGGTPVPAVAVLPGSTASQLIVGAGAIHSFSLQSLVAVDLDYQQQTGYVGSGISAAFVATSAAVNHDANYIRRVTFNVGRVVGVGTTSLTLAQPLLAGVPATGAGVQAVIAFVDREGGSFFQEWSALFVAEAESGGRVCFYYPRLSPNPGGNTRGISPKPGAGTKLPSAGGTRAAATGTSAKRAPGNPRQHSFREDYAEIAGPMKSLGLRASFIALPQTDTNDGQAVLCYRSYFPTSMAAVY